MTVIDPTWIEIQEGLYQEIVVGTFITRSRLHSAEGYCFYDKTDVVYDEAGNVIPDEDVLPTQRILMQYCSTPETDIAELNARFVSIPIEPGYEIVNTPNNNVVA